MFKDDLSIVLCGEAGQGIQTVEKFLTRVLKFDGFNVYATKEYMSRVRGGFNSTEIRVSSKNVKAFVNRIDILVTLKKGAIQHLKNRVDDHTIILGEASNVDDGYKFIEVPFTKIATEIGDKIFSNTVGVGTLSAVIGVDFKTLEKYLEEFFERKGKDIVNKNVEAAKRGFEIGEGLVKQGKIKVEIKKDPDIKDDLLLDGASAIGLGAIAGGCNFISSYPMTPSTGILTFLAEHAKEFGIVAEQAEDEISAVNMAIGAWYAGSRAMVTTAGGGFALMVEGMSLAGMIESPLVVNLGQRPAPATGLPTRTEQGDLLFALYSGHGEFPKILLAPGTLEDAFYLTQKAFYFADKFQVPVIILSDQYLVDSYYNISNLEIPKAQPQKFIVETSKDYKRYQLVENGISPRGIPGGAGLVDVDSDEHDESGHITEDLDIRVKMVEKRLKKFDAIRAEVIPPELIGPKNYETLVVGWGSTYPMIREAIENIGDKKMAFLHFKQVYPVHPDAKEYLQSAKKKIIVENNATSQFGQILKLETGMNFDVTILKYNGMPFSVEELVLRLKEGR
ncbi:MAG: 2-oxoacid:acceptor oxidoreductase subunit alpha [Mesoaciditoga sp.]|uniref:2-oxoacid:acceptor oxidoreductase subunit alpha n=1 Tax=Athalassotoga sp. TaxID=2022597 RepID=UPI000CC8F0BC|nr:MAG: 2-oxoacid:acceptor oxidoreductase subunit alpha [Mesoaciditoga sp.]PMP80334.1 MAG: 2-oxoacid:acceptor oxidoreductase subunit alpha [Mesoaciditoga sp.]HEU25055.1 2-oxoacid:acceptor oxidoreductase subunit alpha [Mesoaciditoga lauensis]